VPPAPELGDGGRLIGCIEVLGEAEAEQQCDSYGHIGVAREVAVDLQCVAVDSHQTLESRIQSRLVEDTVHEVERYIIRDDGLLHKADDDKADARTEHSLGNHQRAANLRNKIPRSHNRACHKLREEREVEHIINPSLQRFYLATIDVDGVAHRLEHEERDSHRQKDILKVEKSCTKQLIRDVNQEVGVFEVAQHSQVDGHTQRNQSLLTSIILAR